MAKIDKVTGLTYTRYEFEGGLLARSYSGTYNRVFAFSLDLNSSSITAYNSAGTHISSQDGYSSSTGMSGFECHVPYTSGMGEYWNITINGKTERYEFGSQSSTLKAKYFESHKEFVPRKTATCGTISGINYSSYFLIPANRTGASRTWTFKIDTDDGGTGLTRTLVQKSQSSRIAWGTVVNGVFKENQCRWDIRTDPTSLTASGGQLNIYVHAYGQYRTIWDDGFVQDDGRDELEMPIGKVEVITNDGSHYATGSESSWYYYVQADMRGGVIRVVPTTTNGISGALEVQMGAGTYNAPVITRIVCADIPASGGSVSQCTVYYTQGTSIAGDSTEKSQTVSFTAVSASTLGNTETFARKRIASRSITVTANGKTSAAATLWVYQSINAKYTEYGSVSATIDNTANVAATAGTKKVTVARQVKIWYTATTKPSVWSEYYPSDAVVYMLRDSDGYRYNATWSSTEQKYIVGVPTNISTVTTTARSFTIYAVFGQTMMGSWAFTQSGNVVTPTDVIKLLTSGTTFYVENNLGYAVMFRVAYMVSGQTATYYYPSANGVRIENGAKSGYFGNTMQWGYRQLQVLVSGVWTNINGNNGKP